MDIAFNIVGINGKFQMIISLITVLVSGSAIFITTSIPFLSKRPTLMCQMRDSFQDDFILCKIEEYCLPNRFNYKIEKNSSLNNLALSFELYCEKELYLTLIGTALFLGGLVGSVILSPVPDKYGRLRIYKILNVVSAIIQINLFLCINPTHFIICAFIAGFCSFNYTMSMLIIPEYLDRKSAGLIMSINNAMFPFCGILLSIFYYFINNWRIFFLITSILTLLMMYLTLAYFVESPR